MTRWEFERSKNMRYEKPVVIDLSLRARTASGEPNGCYVGFVPGDTGICQTGTGPTGSLDYQCATGPNPGVSSPAMCIPGGDPSGMCNTGASGTWEDSCTSGPNGV